MGRELVSQTSYIVASSLPGYSVYGCGGVLILAYKVRLREVPRGVAQERAK